MSAFYQLYCTHQSNLAFDCASRATFTFRIYHFRSVPGLPFYNHYQETCGVLGFFSPSSPLCLSPSQSSEEGAVSPIYCAVAEEMEGITGKYVDSDCSLKLPAPLARDPALAVKDFEICERLTSKL